MDKYESYSQNQPKSIHWGGGYLKSCLATTLILTLSLLLIPNLYTGNLASAESIEGSIYNLSTSIDSNIDITVPQTSTITTGSHNVIVSTTCPAGYTLSIETDNEGKIYRNADTSSEHYLSSVSGTLESPTELENNQWGFSITDPSTNNNKFSAVPTTKTNIKESNSGVAVNSEETTIYYGIKADGTLPSGNYNGTIIYTTTPNPACFAYTIHFNSGSGTPTYPSKNLTYSESIDLSTYSPTKNGYVFAGWSDGTKTYKGTVSAADLNPSNQAEITLTAQWELIQTWNFDYTGGEQTFTAPVDGYYKLETWGAEGGSATAYDGSNTYRGGYGAYSTGIYHATSGKKFYINVGGKGPNGTGKCTTSDQLNANASPGSYYACVILGGYNGGGNATQAWYASDTLALYNLYAGAGGGATHISLNSGQLSTLSSYRNNILIVSGAGGGAVSHRENNSTNHWRGIGGDGGGIEGGVGYSYGRSLSPTPATQTVEGCGYRGNTLLGPCSIFGRGQDGDLFDFSLSDYYRYYTPGGGGGWYGGGASAYVNGGGGSGYIGSSNLISGGDITKHMTCYSCATSTADTTRTYSNTNVSATPTADYAKIGNGYARITLIGTSL